MGRACQLRRRVSWIGTFALYLSTFWGCASSPGVTLKAVGVRPAAELDERGKPNPSAFFRSPAVARLCLSPNGRSIAGVLERDGVQTLFVMPAPRGPLRHVASLDRNQGLEGWTVEELGWGSDARLLVSVSMPSPGPRAITTRQSRLLLVDVPRAEARYLGKKWPNQEYTQFQDLVLSYLPDDPDGLLISLRVPGEKGRGAFRVDLGSGRLEALVSPRRGSLGWAVDHLHRVRAGWGEARWQSREFIVARVEGSGRFRQILDWNPYEDAEGFTFAGFSPDPRVIYVYARRGTDRWGLHRFDLEQGTFGDPVFAPPDLDVEGLRTSRVDGRLLSVSFSEAAKHDHFFDPEWARLKQKIWKALPGESVALRNSDREEKRFIVASSSDTSPPSYYYLDTTTDKMTALFDAYPELEKAQLASMKPITYRARDGLEISGYLTQPSDGSGAPFPLIVYPHGGPWARDVWGWDATVQFLVSRGFAVLQPNFRGSTGYGRAFEERGRGRWGLEMQDDITDAALWAVEAGIADRARIGIYGASYGGYAALRALQREPDLFRAGASFAGVTDLPDMLDDDAHYYGVLDDMEQLVGDRWKDRERLAEASPARGAEQIQGPVLLAHGTVDPVVQVSQAHKMARALKRAQVEVETYLYKGEVHGFLDERNKIDFHMRLARFFERHLMGASSAALAEAPP